MKKASNTKKIVMVGTFSAIAFVLQTMGKIIPPVGGFLEIEFSDLPALIVAFAYGPVAGILIELVKNILHIIFMGSGNIVGELANFVINGTFVGAAGVIYKYHKSFKGAVCSLVAATVAMAVAGIFANLYIMLPLYMSDAPMALKMNIVLATILPFNIAKGVVVSAITMLIYKKISPILKFSGGKQD